jgi:hypothetical protein
MTSKSGIFIITPELEQVLESVPEDDEPCSRLEPFKSYILRWRRQGKSYRKIQRILRNECKVKVHHETLRKFVKLRSKPRKPAEPEIEIEPAAVPLNSKRLTADERQAQLEFIRSLNSKPTLSTQPEKPGWNLVVDKPRVVNKT